MQSPKKNCRNQHRWKLPGNRNDYRFNRSGYAGQRNSNGQRQGKKLCKLLQRSSDSGLHSQKMHYSVEDLQMSMYFVLQNY